MGARLRGKPVGRAIAWPDARAAFMLEGWNEDGRTKRLYQICGNAPIPGLPLVLLSYIKQHEPERYARISTVFCAKDYINYRLTGEIAMDESDLSFFPCDIRGRKVSPELLELAGVPEIMGCLPRVLAIGDIVGRVTRKLPRRRALPRARRWGPEQETRWPPPSASGRWRRARPSP
ncbi:FGGY family carbohydrate kinase [Microvirga aerilata]|uniref:FGGY family carbohydrate kinase n=1 Tax=Microvirga aerilata TaxID=670292 RepID=UPI0036456585